MHLSSRRFSSLFLALLLLFNVEIVFGDVSELNWKKLKLNDCLLPEDHPLQNQLKELFKTPQMFESPQHINQSEFEVINNLHRGLMVASHPSIKGYLIKKFKDEVSQKTQLANYLRRINGARALKRFIKDNRLQHIVVPKKWLYRLPKLFSDPKTGGRTYVLVVEKMDICSGGKRPNDEIATKYYHIDFEILRELCFVLYYFRGLDSVLHNMPFTHDNKIAFIDTERWEWERERYLHHAMPFLSPDRQEYALSVFEELKVQNNR